MSTLTQNYALVKPALSDSPPDITAMNPNWDTIDAQMKLEENNASALFSSKVLKNYIINGGFDVWQDGTIQTTSGYGSNDMWLDEHGGGTTKIHQRQPFVAGQTAVPNNPIFLSETVVTSAAGGYCRKSQKFEDVRKLSGKKVTLSFWVVANANKNIAVEFSQNFGSGGSANILGIGSIKIPVTNAWQRVTVTVTFPSVRGKTIGADSFSALTIWFDAAASFDARTASLGQQSGSFELANFSLVEGGFAQEWQNEKYEEVLRQCQYYYEKSASLGIEGTFGAYCNYNDTNVQISFKVRKRVPPIMRILDYNLNYGAGGQYWINGQGGYAIGNMWTTRDGFFLTLPVNGSTAANGKQFMYTADSRL